MVHQNFPGQFRQLAPHLESRGHELVAICSHQRPVALKGRLFRYSEPEKLSGVPLGSQLWHDGQQRAFAVARLAQSLAADGWKPDRILGHSGWGETLGLSSVWPDVPQILWPELWVRPEHGGYGVDPLKPSISLESQLEQLGRNAMTRAALADASAWVMPTEHQANSLPLEFRDRRLHVIHEGIDTQLAKPNPSVSFALRGITIDRSVPTITLVNRNLERLRGFDVFMRSLPKVFTQHPQVRVLIVGDNEAGYGGEAGPLPLRQRMLKELEGQLDLDRIHFLGRIPHPQLMAVLQASWVHVYLSFPFILGWSLIEAMACGCCIVGSEGAPVSEVIRDGVEGVLIPINAPDRLADQVLKLLADPVRRQSLGRSARQRALLYDQRLTLNQLSEMLNA
ncbi:glycosyltransferase [Synechococcus sp. BS55D]|uniref:glycosyltransferase n=1 Tax=Synechococcus sp. BS55D TaxID=2055943 RepID=UPI001F1655AC|nr:glycosyltransferase [Synechococcus sp. BS55D]